MNPSNQIKRPNSETQVQKKKKKKEKNIITSTKVV